MTTIHLVGGPTAIIEWGGLRLLTDPTFSPPGIYESAPGRPLTKLEGPAVTAHMVLPVDVVLLSHDQHADNLDPAGRAILRSVPLTLTTPEAASRLGGTAVALGAWENTELHAPDGSSPTVTAVPARHGPPGCEPLTGPVTGFMLHGPNLPTIYISGDNASLDVVTQIRQRFGPIDIALIFAGAARTSLFDGAPLTLTSVDAARAATILDASHVVTVHIRGWGHISEGPDAIDEAFAAAGLSDRLTNLAPGERAHWPDPPRRPPAPTKDQRLRGDPNMIGHTDLHYGPGARDRLGDAVDPSVKGAHAALESFYYALNHRDADTLREVWADHPAAQLNNPLGGILRGDDAIADLYDKILTGPVRLQVTFDDVVEYLGDTHAVFAGREVGTYTGPEGTAVPLEIRTTRYFRYEQGHWRQYHHHGSIDDPAALAAYQTAVTG
jgi:L-ascorbate metabolism protein UlaG (beta-lactamase superfamily)/ketosteroid isomerase-like protein